MAKKENYSLFAKEIVKLVGGKSNVKNVLNCMTRLRFELKDESLADEKAIKSQKLVKGVVRQGGQYQVIVGTEVSEIAPLVRSELGINDEKEIIEDTKEDGGQKDKLFNRIFKIISGCIMPLLGVLVGSGLIKGCLVICTTLGWLSDTDGTYIILYAASNAVLYFLPIFVGFNAGKVFKMNQFVAAVIGASIMYPTILTAVNEGTTLTFLKLPVQLVDYSQSLLPIIVAVWLASYLESFLKRILPQIVHLMFVPALTLAIAVPLTLLVVGPIMTIVSQALSTVALAIFNFSPLLGGLLFGALWQLMVLLGLHSAFIPVLMNIYFENGSDPINGVLGLTVWALAGVALGYALKVKSKEEKSLGTANLVSCLCGVTEPTIYSLIVPNFKLFIGAAVGGGVSGAIFASLGGKMYAIGGDGLFRIPAMINPAGLDISFYSFIACAVLALIISTIVTFFVVTPQQKEG